MDAYLSQESFLSLKALSLISSRSNSDGLLIGHQRGHRFFVEKIFPTGKGFFPSLENFFSLNHLFNDRILGFFSFYSDEKKIKKILAPFAYGKLFLEIQTEAENNMIIKSYLIDFENEFFLSPIHLKL